MQNVHNLFNADRRYADSVNNTMVHKAMDRSLFIYKHKVLHLWLEDRKALLPN
jgi:hypothetical protein